MCNKAKERRTHKYLGVFVWHLKAVTWSLQSAKQAGWQTEEIEQEWMRRVDGFLSKFQTAARLREVNERRDRRQRTAIY